MPDRDYVYIGIDPGPVPGMVVIDSQGLFSEERIGVVQCSRHLLTALIYETCNHACMGGRRGVLLQVESFVNSTRSSRASTINGITETRRCIDEVTTVVLGLDNTRMLTRSAAAVKPWATDERLEAAGLLKPTNGMRHARDAARHALYIAVHDGRMRDPLSRHWAPLGAQA